MKSGIHPDYHEITVKMTNGKTFKTMSTYGKKGDTLQLDVDPNTHPAWTGGGALLNEKAGKVAKFNERFGSLGSKKTSAPAVATPQPKAEEKQEEKSAGESKNEAPAAENPEEPTEKQS